MCLQCPRFQVLSALMLKIEVLRHATPCRSDLNPNMKALVFSETSETVIERYDVTALKTWNFQTRSKLAKILLKTAASRLSRSFSDTCQTTRYYAPKTRCFVFGHQRGEQTNNQRTAALCLPERVPSTAHARTRTTDPSLVREQYKMKGR